MEKFESWKLVNNTEITYFHSWHYNGVSEPFQNPEQQAVKKLFKAIRKHERATHKSRMLTPSYKYWTGREFNLNSN